ncbi:hypothetical protein GCM10009775_24270 [Microbacterium aoyamense]|uniref:Lipocalin-like domain-containing protein n=1 Tax=Microbacterium aoyamense TaxID=344166 RepID=A0ABN2PSM6_9MICO|nr:hypothetical protein [Microbacterium aoyamense]
MRALPAVVVLSTLVVLTGCGSPTSAPSPTRASPGDAAGGSDGSSVDVDPLSACLEGTWQLDTADFLAQSQEYLVGLGIPLDSLDVEGGQQLVFAADGFTSQSTDLTWTASMMGQTVTIPSESAGEGAWNGADGALTVTDWVWNVDPADAPPPSGLPPEAEVPDLGGFSLDGATVPDVVCDDETLVLQGADAPLRAVFVRFG